MCNLYLSLLQWPWKIFKFVRDKVSIDLSKLLLDANDEVVGGMDGCGVVLDGPLIVLDDIILLPWFVYHSGCLSDKGDDILSRVESMAVLAGPVRGARKRVAAEDQS